MAKKTSNDQHEFEAKQQVKVKGGRHHGKQGTIVAILDPQGSSSQKIRYSNNLKPKIISVRLEGSKRATMFAVSELERLDEADNTSASQDAEEETPSSESDIEDGKDGNKTQLPKRSGPRSKRYAAVTPSPVNSQQTRRGRKPVQLANNEEEDKKPAAKRKSKEAMNPEKPANSSVKKKRSAATSVLEEPAMIVLGAAKSSTKVAVAASTAKKSKKKAPKARIVLRDDSSADGGDNEENNNNDNGDDESSVEERPFKVEYSVSSRARCVSCDTIIAKGEVRVSCQPLFRGKRGFQVFRHLQCAVFSKEVERPQDVGNWDALSPEDMDALATRIEESKMEVEKENAELQPDELVQQRFQGEIRGQPNGLTATLLPFQVEGLSWMYHQETKVPEIKGGILADEMGMGKTIQTFATILDNRPLLQHSKPGAKHPPASSDIEERKNEELLWATAVKDWKHEMEMNNIPKKIHPKKHAAARAGTLVVCPLIAISQWKSEIEKFSAPNTVSVGVYHGQKRTSSMPVEMMMKFDIVLTTYQVLEQEFRKMTSPNKVTCPNCGGKYKIDKLRVHLKYFCGEAAERTEAQARQRRSSENRHSSKRKSKEMKKSMPTKAPTKVMTQKKTMTKPKTRVELKSTVEYESESDLSYDDRDYKKDTGVRPSRVAARSASKKVAAVAKDQLPLTCQPVNNESEDESSYTSDSSSTESSDSEMPMPPKGNKPPLTFQRVNNNGEDESSYSSDSSSTESSDSEMPMPPKVKKRKQHPKTSSEEKSGDDELARAVAKQAKAIEAASKKKGKKTFKKQKPKKKRFKKSTPESDSSDSDSSEGMPNDPMADIDLDALTEEAMDGCRFSSLHSLCWWRIVLDEAHFIKTRSSQTAAAAFSLTSIHRWCLSGTPLQNRVGELYSLIRFLRLDPMAYYMCRTKGCDCRSIHYRIKQGVCLDCNHRAFTHYAHFNKHVLNVIQREGYSGDGRRAMFKLKTDVLDKCLLRRTKQSRAEDMCLPPRLVTIRYIRLHPIEEDFYQALYTQTKSSFDDYVAEGTLLNNYAHIFDLLTRMRQAVDHPYLIVYSRRSNARQSGAKALAVANGSVECEICHEPPTDRVLSSCCQAGFCRGCVLEYLTTAGGSDDTPCPSCRAPFTIDLNQAGSDTVDDGNLTAPTRDRDIPASKKDPTLKDLPHVATGSILRRINLADFATSTKIEVLVQSLVEMRQTRPGGKALVFSQFVNMLDLVRWRLHSDPFLAQLGLGVRILHGAMDIKSRDAALKDFREDPHCRVLLMSLKAAGVALNLTVASECYLLDLWWNPAAEMQAIDRCHRLGQHRPIRAVRFVAEGTVEERVLQLQEKKRLVFDGTVGGDAGSLKMLTVDDMKGLFQ